MPAPFPGMDPFLESQHWRSFHSSFIAQLHEVITALVRPDYVVDVDDNLYPVREHGDLLRIIVPDWAKIQNDTWQRIDPVKEHFVVVRSRNDDEAVAVIEVLTPTNKLSRDGRTEYVHKRNNVLRSEAHLLEIDLLRGGHRLPTVEPLPVADYFVFVSRVDRRPKVEVYPWPLERWLPMIPIPLADGDPDVPLDLQAVFDSTYDRAGYDYALKYSKPIDPPLSETQRAWVAEILAKSTPSQGS